MWVDIEGDYPLPAYSSLSCKSKKATDHNHSTFTKDYGGPDRLGLSAFSVLSHLVLIVSVGGISFSWD